MGGKQRELQHHLISLISLIYTSKDDQEIANTRGISNNVLHVEKSETRKRIANSLSTTLKKLFLLTYNKPEGWKHWPLYGDSAARSEEMSKEISSSDNCIFFLNFKTPSISCNTKIVSLLKDFLHSMSVRPCASASKSVFQALNDSDVFLTFVEA